MPPTNKPQATKSLHKAAPKKTVKTADQSAAKPTQKAAVKPVKKAVENPAAQATAKRAQAASQPATPTTTKAAAKAATSQPAAPTRGRPRTITREKIADAGIAIGLPHVTFIGVAAAMGISHMALYKHVPSLDALKHLIAEEIFKRWQLPQATRPKQVSLVDYLTGFTNSTRQFVKDNPGVTPFVIRRLAATPAMLEKIDAHQTHIAQAYGISKEQSRWLLATVTFFCISAAETVYTAALMEPLATADIQLEEAEMDAELSEGVRALIEGAVALLNRAA